MTHFLAVSCMLRADIHTHTHAHAYIHTHSRRAGLFGWCPRPCYEISLGKQRGPWTGHRDRNRERKRAGERLPSPDKIPLFICPTLPSPSPYIPSSFAISPSFSDSSGTDQKPIKAYTGSRLRVSHCEIPRMTQTRHFMSALQRSEGSAGAWTICAWHLWKVRCGAVQ